MIVLLLDERTQDDEDWYELLGVPKRLVSSHSFQTTERLVPSLTLRSRRVPFVLGKKE